MDEETVLIATEALGDEAKAFVKSDLGQYLSGIAEQDVNEAKRELFKLDPYSIHSLPELQAKIASIQMRAKVALQIDGYINEAITRGIQASQQLDQEVDD
jgi:hypothetical protein